MKNCFLDCGTNLGQGLNEFNKKFNLFNNNWDIYTFEPNPDINLNILFTDVNNITKINKAIWIKNCTLRFRKQGKNGNLCGGGSILDNIDKKCHPDDVNYEFDEVEAIDFAIFLLNLKNKYNKIIVKMDIEGAEFQVIDHLINNNILNIIDELYIEQHIRFNYERDQWKNKEKEINNLKNIFFDKIRNHVKYVEEWY